jgi:hypothetical protein
MSKMDGLRAMREARYANADTAASARATAAPEAPHAGQPLCGHRAISGRTCTREQGHAAKSHRYAEPPTGHR